MTVTPELVRQFATLLRDLCRLDLPERVHHQLPQLAADPQRWALLNRVAAYEGVESLLAFHGLRLDLPQSARSSLSEVRAALLYRDTLNAALRGRVLRALSAAGIETLLLKGSDLVQRVYPESWLRPMNDVDVLVPPDDRRRAEAVLAELGLRRHPTYPNRPGKEALNFESAFVDEPVPGFQLMVELHETIANAARFTIDVTGLWRRSEVVLSEGVPTRRLQAEDLLCHLLLHLGAHFYMLPLRALADVHLLISDTVLAWPRVVQTLRGWGASRLAYYALRMVIGSFGTEVPQPVVAELRPPLALRWWVERWLPAVTPPTPRQETLPFSPQIMLYFPLLDRHRQRFGALRQELQALLLDLRLSSK